MAAIIGSYDEAICTWTVSSGAYATSYNAPLACLYSDCNGAPLAIEWPYDPAPKPSPNGTGRDWSLNHHPALFGYRALPVTREHTRAGRRAPWPVQRRRERRTRRELRERGER